MIGETRSSPVLHALRERTRALHLDLEQRLLLGLPHAGRADYAGHVAAMWGWISPLEQRLRWHHWPAELEAERRWEKAGWLQQDIEAARADGFLAAPPALCGHESDLSTAPARYGWAYVIEGSMLGGQVLLKRLGERLRPWPMRYLQGYGAAAGQRWRSFLTVIERDVHTQADIDTASRAAAQAFGSVGLWLRERGAA